MTKAFQLFLWENAPSVNTPLGEALLNRVNVAVNEIDNRVITHETTKANQSDLLTAIADVSMDRSTGVWTFTKKNGAEIKIDTLLEKLAINFSFDAENQRLVITLDDGTVQYADLKALITELEFLNSDTVLFSVTDGKVSASIAKGSITADMIEPNYLANVQLYASQALSSANSAKESAVEAESYAHGGTGTRDGEDTDNAKYYMEQTKAIAGADLENIISGTTPVGDSEKLGGKVASEYALLEDLETYEYPTIAVTSDNDFQTKLDSLFASVADCESFSRRIAISYAHSVFAGGSAILRGFRQSSLYGHCVIEKRISGTYTMIATRSLNNGVWSDWRDISDGGNADTVDGFHASDFVNKFRIGTIGQSYRVFARMDVTLNNEPETILISGGGGFSNEDGLWAVCFYARPGSNQAFIIRELIPLKTGEVKFGWYTDGNYRYFGMYTSYPYSSVPFIVKLDGSSNDGTYNAEYGEFYTSATMPTGWAEVTTYKFATDADLANYMPKTGGIFISNIVNLFNGYGELYTDANASMLRSWSKANDRTNGRSVLVANAVHKPSVAGALILRDTVNGIGKDYEILHSGNAKEYTAGSAEKLNGRQSSEPLTTDYGTGSVKYRFAMSAPQFEKFFPTIDNSNALLQLNRHDGGYISQLGFSSDHNIYYRASLSAAWRKILDSNNIAEHALPINKGGTVTSSEASPIKVNCTNENAQSVMQEFYKLGTLLGKLGVSANGPVYRNSNNIEYALHHDGNSAKVVQGTTAPSDTTAVWVDTANKVIKIYKDGAWTQVS